MRLSSCLCAFVPACLLQLQPQLPPLPALPEFPVQSMEPAVSVQFQAVLDRLDRTPLDAGANGALGMLYHAYGFHALAQPCYRRAAALDPADRRWPFYLGVVLLHRGRLVESAGSFDVVLGADPDDHAALLHRAEARLGLNDLAGAAADFRRAIELRPGSARAWCGAGRAAFRGKDFDAAVADLRRATALAPDYGSARYVLGQALREQDRLEEARRELELARQQLDDEPGIEDARLEALVALRTGAIDALHRGIELLKEGRTREAIERLGRAVRLDPRLAEAHSQLGAALLAAGLTEPAEAELARAVELDPDFADAHYNLGLAAHRRGRFDEAVQRFARAVAIRQGHFDAHLALGTDLPGLGRGNEAVAHLRKARSLRPDDARPYKRLAAVLGDLGRYEEAIAILRAGAARLGGDAALRDRLAWFLATCPDDAFRDPGEALPIAEAVCRQTGGTVAQPLDTRAAALAALGQFEQALADAELARQLAETAGDADLAGRISARLAGYRDGRPYRMVRSSDGATKQRSDDGR